MKHPIVRAPRLALGAIKTFRGMEGFGLNANLYFDDKLVAFLIDDGNGGEMITQWKNLADQKAVTDYLTSLNLPAEHSEEFNIDFPQDLEHLVNMTVDAVHHEKQLKRLMKTNVLYRLSTTGPNEFMVCKHHNQPERCKEFLKKTYPDIQFIG